VAVSRGFANVLTDDVDATREFYVDLLGLRVAFESDWFVNLTSAPVADEHGAPGGELGIWRRDHELIPAEFRQCPAASSRSSSTMWTRPISMPSTAG
jgi:catechol 2,3-dioxygenase-like lactoylglutathione lyase family enzyme